MEHQHEEHIHMPPPSLSPIILGAGMTFLGFSIAPTIFRIPFILLGIIGIVIGLGTWVYDEVKNASTVEETGDGSHH
jgi:hypothetical protein